MIQDAAGSTLFLLTTAASGRCDPDRNSLDSLHAVNRRVALVNRRRETQDEVLTGGSPEGHKHAAVSGGKGGSRMEIGPTVDLLPYELG